MEAERPRILIVDDHEAIRRGLRYLLSNRPNWEICGEAIDGIDGIEKAKSLRPDLILMDVSMPRMDGLQATRILRKELPGAKIVIVIFKISELLSVWAAICGRRRIKLKLI